MTMDVNPWNLDSFDPQRVWDLAVQALDQIGLHVENAALLGRVAGELHVRDQRVCFPPEVTARFTEELRARSSLSSTGADSPPSAPPSRPALTLTNSGVQYQYHDAATGEVRRYDTPTLIEHTRYVFQMREEGRYHGQIPGYPGDVPPRLQLITEYYLNCLYNPHPGSQGLATTVEEAPFNIEIAEAMGNQHLFWAEPLSPMRLAGSSVDAVTEFFRPGMAVGIDPMPIMGITAPLDWHAAWAQSVAENLAGYILFRLWGVEDVYPTLRLFVPNMATGMAYFSSPMHLTALLTRRRVRDFFGMTTDGGELLLVAAKEPGIQAAAEKMAGCVAGAMMGFRYLEGAGALHLDVIFSPLQLQVDLEIVRYVEAMMAALPAPVADALEEVRAGVEAGSYLSAPQTLDHFAEYGWRPRLFDLSMPGSHAESLLSKANKTSVAEVAARYTWELRDERREALERIMERARQTLS